MEIIIDGYNVIGSDTGLTGNLEHRRNLLVQHLASYRKNKGLRTCKLQTKAHSILVR